MNVRTESQMRGARTALAVGLLAAVAGAQVAPIIPIRVVNGSSVDRVGEPVSVGIPVQRLPAFYSTFGARIQSPGGVLIPSQFKVLTRWGGVRTDATKPIRWMLATFRADVPANSTVEYMLALSGTGPVGTLNAVDAGSYLTVNTAPETSFRIDKNAFSVFDQVIVNGVPMTSGPGWLDFVFADGTSPVPVVTSTVLEDYAGENTLRCVIRQKGTIGPLAFTCRWTFHAGRKDVAMDFRLENPAAYGLFSNTIADGQKYFDRCFLALPIAGASHTATSTSGARPLPAGSLYKVEQRFAWGNLLDALAGFSYEETMDGTVVGSGGRYAGALDLASPTGGVTATVDRFWQNFPKAMHAENGALKIGLWPEYGSGPYYQGQYAVPWNPTPPVDPQSLVAYRFEGSRWKTHRVIFDFHTGGARTPTQVATEAERAGKPLAGLAPGWWIRKTWAMGSLWTERDPNWSNLIHNRYERFYDVMVDDNAADSLPSLGKIGYPKFLERGGTNGGWQMYGWDSYGDLGWADGYCSNHYDLTESVLSGFYRTGDYRFFDRGRDMAFYRRDYGQNHSTNTAETWRGAQFYEKGWWHGSYVQGQYSHNWVAGLLLHYVMTGDEASREAAIENLAFVLRDPPKNWNGYWGSRIPGWQVNCLVDGYTFLGDPAYLAEAGLGVAKFRTLEIGQGSNGYVLNLGTSPLTTKPWMDNIFFIAAARYVIASGDSAPIDLLDRMRDFFKTTCIVPASGAAPVLVPAQVYYEWGPSFTGVKSIHLLWAMSEALSYSAAIFADQDDENWSTMCFETVCRYWQLGPTTSALNYYDATTWSKVTFKPGNWPGTESKAFANLLRWGPSHLTVQRYLDGRW